MGSLARENKNVQEFTKSDVYANYFSAPYIQKYFDMNGISIPTVEGAKHRLPFILNILDAFGIIEFVGASKFRILNIPMVKGLFENDGGEINANDLLLAAQAYFNSGIIPSREISSVLKQFFGADFLTDAYKIRP